MTNKGKGTTKHCFFNGCVSDSRYGPQAQFISFPKACLDVRKKLVKSDQNHIENCSTCKKCSSWIILCKRNDEKFNDLSTITRHTFICTHHFVHKNGPCETYPEPLPAIEAHSIRETLESSQRDHNHQRQHETQQTLRIDGDVSDDVEMLHLCRNNEAVFTENTVNMLNDCNIMQVENIAPTSSRTQESVKMKNSATGTILTTKNIEHIHNKIRSLKKEVTRLNGVIRKMAKKKPETQSNSFTKFVDSMRANDKKCRFYTNLTFSQIEALLGFLEPTDKMRYWRTKAPRSHCRRKLSTLQELILTLVRLRTGSLVQDLSYRFGMSTQYISNIVITWVQHAYHKFNIIRPLMFASREKVKENLPGIFKRLKNIRVILDCAEFFCESPSNFEHQGNLYSSYKAHTTFKVLIGCTPNGAVSFVSDLFEGSISDKEIVKKSKLLDFLEDGDLVLADRGFDIKDVMDSKNVRLNIPPFLKGRDRLTAEEEIETKNIAKERIFVEHVVGRLKRFRLLKKILPLKMRPILSQIVFVCSCLLNFQQPILQKDENNV